MEECLGYRKVSVTSTKYQKLDGTVSKRIKSGILNMPEENPDIDFWIRKTETGFLVENYDNGGYRSHTRRSGIQTVITVGRMEDVSTRYKCYKIDTGYKFEKATLMAGIGSGENIIYLHTNNRGGKYICIPLEFLKYLKLKPGDYLKYSVKTGKDIEITIEKAEETDKCKSDLHSRVNYVMYDGRNKSLSICKRFEKYFEDCETMVCLKTKGKLKILRLLL